MNPNLFNFIFDNVSVSAKSSNFLNSSIAAEAIEQYSPASEKTLARNVFFLKSLPLKSEGKSIALSARYDDMTQTMSSAVAFEAKTWRFNIDAVMDNKRLWPRQQTAGNANNTPITFADAISCGFTMKHDDKFEASTILRKPLNEVGFGVTNLITAKYKEFGAKALLLYRFGPTSATTNPQQQQIPKFSLEKYEFNLIYAITNQLSTEFIYENLVQKIRILHAVRPANLSIGAEIIQRFHPAPSSAQASSTSTTPSTVSYYDLEFWTIISRQFSDTNSSLLAKLNVPRGIVALEYKWKPMEWLEAMITAQGTLIDVSSGSNNIDAASVGIGNKPSSIGISIVFTEPKASSAIPPIIKQ